MKDSQGFQVWFFHILPCFDTSSEEIRKIIIKICAKKWGKGLLNPFLTFISGHKNSISKICVDLSLAGFATSISFFHVFLAICTMRPCHEGIQLNFFFYFRKGLKSWETGGKVVLKKKFWIETSYLKNLLKKQVNLFMSNF